MSESPFQGPGRASTAGTSGAGGRRTPQSVIPDVPLRRPGSARFSRSSLWRTLPDAVLVCGTLLVLLAVTLLTERQLSVRERARLEAELLQLPSLSGEPIDRPLERLDAVRIESARIREAYGVRVHYLYSPNRFFPRSWRGRRVSATAKQLPLDELQRQVPLIRHFLDRYPEHLIRENLTDIYLSSNLSLHGAEYGGTYVGTAIHVAGAGPSGRSYRHFLPNALHHEFSSILMHRYGFPFEDWRAVNEAGFTYPNNPVEWLGTEQSYEVSKDLLMRGFLRGYAQSDIENDFNVMAEWLFLHRPALEVLAGHYDRIGKKMRLAQAFYARVDPAIRLD